MSTFPSNNTTNNIMSHPTNIDPMDSALAALRAKEGKNVLATAKAHDVERMTLKRRYDGTHLSHAQAASMYRRKLNDAQEEELVRYIKELTDKGLPPTSKMIKNIAEEIACDSVGKNWIEGFLKRHENELTSRHLANIDFRRKKCERKDFFETFYQLVSTYIHLSDPIG